MIVLKNQEYLRKFKMFKIFVLYNEQTAKVNEVFFCNLILLG